MSTPTAPAFWNIPYQRNPFFTEQGDVLNLLHRSLQVERIVSLFQPQGITGLGGIGKTQTALEYAYRYQSEYDAVLWVRADSLTSLTSSLIELAHVLKLPERNEQDQEIIVQAVLLWFRLHTNWLLIYDNIEDFSIAEPFLPKAGAGHLLFTTRAYALGGLAYRLEIQKMEPEIGALLLLRRADIIALEAMLDMANPDDRGIAHAISQELDGLPLALDQAGAYIKEAPCPLLDYLGRYQTRRSDILRLRGDFDQNYPASVATTWSLSFEKVAQSNPTAADLLYFCAFLSPDAIPEELITQGAPHISSQFQVVASNPIALDGSIAALRSYSLIVRHADNNALSIHRLVQAILQDSLPSGMSKQWKERTVQAVNVAFPEVEYAHWPECERCISHALVCAMWIEQEGMVFAEAAYLLNQAAGYLTDRTRYTEAEPLLIKALAIREQLFGAFYMETAQSLNNLALLYDHLGKYTDAESLLMRALGILEPTVGKERLFFARALNNLANLYCDQGLYEKAEPLFQKAYAIHQQEVGEEHPDTAKALNNLVGLYTKLGRYKNAEASLRRALTIYEQKLGKWHPETIAILSNLAVVYREQGSYGLAEALFKDVQAYREKELGEENIETGRAIYNRAMLYHNQKKYREADEFYTQALSIYEQQLGRDHPELTPLLNNIGLLYFELERNKEAASFCERALVICKLDGHPDMVVTLYNLGLLYMRLERFSDAEQSFQDVLVLCAQRNCEHSIIITSLDNLISLYMEQGRYAEVESLLLQSLTIQERELGSEHTEIANRLNNLAMIYEVQEKSEQAKHQYRRSIDINTKLFGWEANETKAVRSNYADLLRKLGQDVEASRIGP